MALGKASLDAARLEGERCFLAPPQLSDQDEFLAAVRQSQDLHAPWVAPPQTPEDFAAYVAGSSRIDQIRFLIRQRQTQVLVGVITISQMVKGVFQSSYLGFYAFSTGQGQGLMSEGLALALRNYFETLGFHRIEANIQPGNVRSLRLVKRLGFRHEGFSPRYLFIDGAWRDHERFALTAEDYRQGQPSKQG